MNIKHLALGFCITGFCLSPAMAQVTSTGNGAVSQTSAQGQGWSSEASKNMSSQGCDPLVTKAISTAQQANIKGRTQLANDLYKRVLNNMKYEALSCLKSMMPSAIFQRETGFNLRSQIESFVCQGVTQMVDPMVERINDATSTAEGTVNGYVNHGFNIGGGSFNLGTIQSGFQLTGGEPLLTPIRSLYAVDGNSSSNVSGASNASGSSYFSNSGGQSTAVNIFGIEN